MSATCEWCDTIGPDMSPELARRHEAHREFHDAWRATARSRAGAVSDLTEFLLARISEDEAVADQFRLRWIEAGMSPRDLDDDHGTYPSTEYTEIGLGLGRWTAECEAKRRIADGLARLGEWDGAIFGVLLLLALPYADHPDYREEWRL